jgi:acetyl esterase
VGVDRQSQWILERVAEEPAFQDPAASIAALRAGYDRLFGTWGPQAFLPTREEWVWLPFRSTELPTLVVEPVSSEEAIGTCLLIHGGGWTFGGPLSYAQMARALAGWSGARVIVPDYPLVPETTYPAAHEAVRAVYGWIAQAYGGPVALVGDSVGGTMAAALAAEGKSLATPPVCQVLLYPVLDVRPGVAYRSRGRLGDGRYFLTENAIENAAAAYVPNAAERESPALSPVNATSFQELPPTFILLPEFDPLIDEGRAYAAALQQAGVANEVREIPGTIHGCVSFGGVIAAGAQGLRYAAAFARRCLQTKTHLRTSDIK